jgi:general secretion pathway protein D
LKASLFSFILLASSLAMAAPEAEFAFAHKNAELDVVVGAYSKATGQKFIIDPGARGKVTILNTVKVSAEEAFHLMSTALAINGYAIVKEGDLMIVRSARNVQRSLMEVSSVLPAMRPERMTTWVFKFKNTSAENINKDLRMLTSKDGEMSVHMDTNSVIISDWSSNMQRVAKIFELVDVKK